MVPYLWPKDQPWIRRRVVLALVLLFAAKVVTVITPFFYRAAVNALAGDAPSAGWAVGAGAVGLAIARCRLCPRCPARPAPAGARNLPPHSPPLLALPHHPQDGRPQPGDRARREGGGIPAALHALQPRPADPRASDGGGDLLFAVRGNGGCGSARR